MSHGRIQRLLSGVIYREVHYYAFNGADTTEPRHPFGGTIDLQGHSGQPFADQYPAAPMVCMARRNPFQYGKAMCVWSDGDSICIAMLYPMASCPLPPTVHVPNSAGGYFPAIEPGNNHVDTADAIDFDMSWHDYTGVKTVYLEFNCGTNVSPIYYKYEDFAPAEMNSYDDKYSTFTSYNTMASLVVSSGAEPIVSFENISYWDIQHPGCDPPPVCINGIVATSIITKMKPSHNSVWGGERIISKYFLIPDDNFNYNMVDIVVNPSITLYPNLSSYSLFYQHHYNDSDMIQNTGADTNGFIGDSSFALINDYTIGCTPFQPFVKLGVLPSFVGNVLWSYHSLGTNNIESASAIKGEGCPPQICNPPNNSNGFPYTDAIISWSDSARIKFMAGEMQYIGKSGTSAIAQKEMNMTTPIDSIGDAEGQLHTLNFKIKDDTAKIAILCLPMLTDTMQTPRAIDTGMLTVKINLYDSASKSVLQTLNMISVIGVSPFITGATGLDTAKIIGDSGKTCYIGIEVDTLHAPHTVTVIPAQEVSEDQLSVLIAPPPPPPPPPLPCDAGFGKTMQSALPSDPINLTSAPNPFYPKSDISFTVPASR